jgi:hypothetical protein
MANITKEGINDLFLEYLKQNQPEYDDVIANLTDTIRGYYDNLEKRKQKEKEERERVIRELRNDVVEAATDYMDALYGGFKDEEYKAVYEALIKAIADSEKEIVKFFSAIKKMNTQKKTENMLNKIKIEVPKKQDQQKPQNQTNRLADERTLERFFSQFR